jgi:hypothetical protein
MRRNTNTKYRNLRARLISRGITLRRWAISHGVPVGSVYAAAIGTRSGAKAVRIRRQLENFLNG